MPWSLSKTAGSVVEAREDMMVTVRIVGLGDGRVEGQGTTVNEAPSSGTPIVSVHLVHIYFSITLLQVTTETPKHWVHMYSIRA